MRKISAAYAILALSVFGVATQSCNKNNGIDNNRVITKPYTLYVVDSQGAIFNTNDGLDYKKTIFPPDGLNPVSLATSGENIIMVKSGNVFVSEDEGAHFNLVEVIPSPSGFHQSVVIDVPSFDKRVYIGSATGVSYSADHGVKNSWRPDNSTVLNGAVITSFTQLMDGKLIAYDDVNKKFYRLDDLGSNWVVANGSGFPGGGQFFISHYANTVVAADMSGTSGVWYSNDNGNSWSQYAGVPTGVRIYSAYSPFEKVLLLGLEGQGVLRLPLGSTTFQPANNGLDNNTIVRAITAKSNSYKNDSRKPYVYIATNTGVYRSEDNGENWIKVKSGNFTTIY